MKYLIILAVVILQGCAGAMLAAGVVGITTVEITGKSVSDHAISAYHGKDCKMLRKMQGQDICQDQPNLEVVAKDKPNQPIPPMNPSPKKIVVVSNSISDTEQVFAQRKATK